MDVDDDDNKKKKNDDDEEEEEVSNNSNSSEEEEEEEDDDDDEPVIKKPISEEERIKLDPTPDVAIDDDEDDTTAGGSGAVDPITKAAKSEAKAIRMISHKHKDELKAIREEQNALMNKDKSQNAANRLAFLQRQAEVFSRFMAGDSAKAEKSKRGKKKSSAGEDDGVSGGGRTRKSEEDEDAELIETELHGTRLSRITVQPGCITGTMRAYQIEGLNWMINLYEQGINGILADEMGLGKTLQSISLLGYLKFERGVSGPHIVVVPKSVLGNWLREFKRWCPGLRVIKIHGTKEEREKQITEDMRAGTFDVVVTTYEIAIKEQSAFNKFEWRYIVIDEAHRLKNESTRLSIVVRDLKVQFRMLITGTPLQNNLHELWALLNFLLPEVFSDSAMFEEFFKLEQMDQEQVVGKLHSILRPFMIRRLKADVEKSLPPKREIKLYTGMTEMQEYWYKSTLNKDVAALNQLGGPEKTRLLNILMQLRKVCNHPYLFQGAEPGPPYFDGPHMWENAGKMILLDKLLAKLKQNGDRVLIFSQMTRLLDILEDYMRYKGYQYCRIDGNTKGEERDLFMDQFNVPGSEKFVFLLSTRAGGLGINLATANIVILYDSDWNPQMDLQAQDRAHRIGQTKEVTVFRFVTEGTVEEKIVERAEKKLYLDAVVVQQGRLQQTNKSLDKTELMSMVKFGAEAIFKSGGVKVTDDDIDLILDRSTKKTEELRAKLQTDVQHNLLNFKLDNLSDKHSLGFLVGDDDPTSSGMNFINLPQRDRRKNYDVNKLIAEQMGTESSGPNRSSKQKGITMHDFQFFDQKAVRELEEKERNFAERRRTQIILIKEAKQREMKEKRQAKSVLSTSTPPLNSDGTTTGGIASEEVTAMDTDDAVPSTEQATEELESVRLTRQMEEEMDLTPEEKARKAELFESAFGNWNRRDFRAYTGACERFGRDKLDAICNHVVENTGKTKAEVKAYHEVFWKRYKEIGEWEKIIDRIEKGEQKIVRREQITDMLDRKVKKTKNPWQTLTIDYGNTRGKSFTEEEDRFIICMMQRIGYGNWEQLRQEIRKAWCFRFDWFIKSRTAPELQRRCDTLIRVIEKEDETMNQGGATNSSSADNKDVEKHGGSSLAHGGGGNTGSSSTGGGGASKNKRKRKDTNDGSEQQQSEASSKTPSSTGPARKRKSSVKKVENGDE